MQDEFNINAPEILDSTDIKAEDIYCREATGLMASSALEKSLNSSTQVVDSNIRPDCCCDALKSTIFGQPTTKLTSEPQTSQSNSTSLPLQGKKIKEPIYQDGGDACVIGKEVQGIASCLETDNKAVSTPDIIPSEAYTVTTTGAENISLAKNNSKNEFRSPDSCSSDTVNAHQEVDNSFQFQNMKYVRPNLESTQQYPTTHLEGLQNHPEALHNSLTVVKTINMESDFIDHQLNLPNESKEVDENGREDLRHPQGSSPTCDEDKPNLSGYRLHPNDELSDIQSAIPLLPPSTNGSDGDNLEVSGNRLEKPDEHGCLSLYNKLGYEDDCRAEIQAVAAENSILFDINETGLDDWELSEASEILGQQDDSSDGQEGYSPVRDLMERDHINLPNNRLFASKSMDLEHGLILIPERSSDVAPEVDGSLSPASSEGESDGEQEKLEVSAVSDMLVGSLLLDTYSP
uniref:uncharacterized protein n=1 Tax=Myxine glutinosa TaxID=7769 RepID=UPI00358E52FC